MKLQSITENKYDGLDLTDSFGEESHGVGSIVIKLNLSSFNDACEEISETLGTGITNVKANEMVYTWNNVNLTQTLIDYIYQVIDAQGRMSKFIKWEFIPR